MNVLHTRNHFVICIESDNIYTFLYEHSSFVIMLLNNSTYDDSIQRIV